MSIVQDGLPSTNMLLVGEKECQRRIVEFIDKAKKAANLPSRLTLDGLGLCLSGCENSNINNRFKKSLMENYPNLTRSCSIESDTIGSIMTAAPTGGIVIIAGTGSNCLLLNPNGERNQCGGWGYILGDEGSAYRIALQVIKTVIDHEEGLCPSKDPIDRAKKAIYDYFKIRRPIEMYEHIYVNFDKSYLAGVCASLAKEAREGDPLLCKVFQKAGTELAMHIRALLPNVDETLLKNRKPLIIACVGSVFKSWPLLQKGFVPILEDKGMPLNLVQLRRPAAIGAAYLAAKDAGYHLPMDFRENWEILAQIGVEKSNQSKN
ncbi:N-acetyl-D-glucosamine kinase-like isoform X2 [Brevipalpus obovatus]